MQATLPTQSYLAMIHRFRRSQGMRLLLLLTCKTLCVNPLWLKIKLSESPPSLRLLKQWTATPLNLTVTERLCQKNYVFMVLMINRGPWLPLEHFVIKIMAGKGAGWLPFKTIVSNENLSLVYVCLWLYKKYLKNNTYQKKRYQWLQ